MKKEFKSFNFLINETKEIERDGKKYGIVKGYASTYGNIDRGKERVIKGAFSKTINDYKSRKRMVKVCYQHNTYDGIIGGIPFDKIIDDDSGLYVEAELNLEVQKGYECYALAKQGVISDFSIGYSVNDSEMADGIRDLKDLTLWEISLVGEPMNQLATITAVKALESLTSLKEVEDFLKKPIPLKKKERKLFISKVKDICGLREVVSEKKENEGLRDVASEISEKLDQVNFGILSKKIDLIIKNMKF